MRQELVEDALAMAIAARPKRAPDLVHHGDNGSQYASWTYTQTLADAGIRPSRGRTGTALDNAMAESVIAIIKTELVKRRPWPTRLDLELALVAYIGWYNWSYLGSVDTFRFCRVGFPTPINAPCCTADWSGPTSAVRPFVFVFVLRPPFCACRAS